MTQMTTSTTVAPTQLQLAMAIAEMREHLASAFGGYSVYGHRELGLAIAGHIHNGGWKWSPQECCHEAALQESDRWEERWPAGQAAECETVALDVCREALSELGRDPNGALYSAQQLETFAAEKKMAEEKIQEEAEQKWRDKVDDDLRKSWDHRK